MPIIRRSRLERYFDILKIVSKEGPIKQTHIMYKANLTWDELRKDIGWLLELRLICKDIIKQGIFYKVTNEGNVVLSHITSIESSLKLHDEVDQKPRYVQKFIEN